MNKKRLEVANSACQPVLAGILVQSLSSSLVGLDLSIISRIRLLEVRLSVSFLTWISRL